MPDEKDANLAMQLAKDEEAVQFLADRVLNEARSTVFRELKGIAVIVGLFLSILGISAWSSIDDKVETQVTKAVSEEIKERGTDIQSRQDDLLTKVGGLQHQSTNIENQANQTSKHLADSKLAIDTLNKESQKALAEIRRELAIVQTESRKTQTYLIMQRGGPPSESSKIQVVIGPLPKHVYIMAGSEDFGMGSESQEGGFFTTALIKAMDSATDTDKSGAVSLTEIANACRTHIVGTQKPIFGGKDVAILDPKNSDNNLPDIQREMYVLLIGLNSVDPKAFNGWSGKLLAPESDVDRMKQLLETEKRLLAGNVTTRVLKTKQAMGSTILSSIKDLGSQVSKDDFLVIYFSGHGTQIPNSQNTPKRLTQCIVAYDREIELSEVLSLIESIDTHRVVLIIDT